MRRYLIVTEICVGLLFVLSATSVADPWTVTVGNVGIAGSPEATEIPVAAVQTDIDLASPASATGTVDAVTFAWSVSNCPSALKIKFFHRVGDALVFFNERGPFDSNSAGTVPLLPAVSVEQGDLIGITRLTSCGRPLTFARQDGYVVYSGDVEGTVSLAAGTRSGDLLRVQATGPAFESVSHVIPVAISTGGQFGAFFRTEVQVHNAGGNGIYGRFIFHSAAGFDGLPPPEFPFSVPAYQTIFYSDILEAMGQSGVGSIDIVLAAGFGSPVVVARVFNDTGGPCARGFTEDAVDLSQTAVGSASLGAITTNYLLGPADTTNSRFHIGVRTFFAGATLEIFVSDSSGNLVASTEYVYPPTFFAQIDAATFTGAPLSDNESIQIYVTAGAAVVYGVSADNVTNDPSIHFAHVAFFGPGRA